MPLLISLLGSAALAGLLSWWVTHEIDSAAYEALQLADAQATIEQIAADQAAATAAQARYTKATVAAAAQLVKAGAERTVAESRLTAVLNMEGMSDATLAACLSTHLPADVLQQLTR